jgi:hypothetical protein
MWLERAETLAVTCRNQRQKCLADVMVTCRLPLWNSDIVSSENLVHVEGAETSAVICKRGW